MEESVKNDIMMSALCDVYSSLLTDMQVKVLRLAVDDDFSLTEISEILGISRQAVSKNVNIAKAKLLELESKLNKHVINAKLLELKTALKQRDNQRALEIVERIITL